MLVSFRMQQYRKVNLPGNVSRFSPDMIEADFWHQWLHQLHTEGVVSERHCAATW